MQLKTIINLLVGLACSALVAWKGPGVAAAVVGALLALVTLIGTLHIVPASAQEALDDASDALKEQAKKEGSQ